MYIYREQQYVLTNKPHKYIYTYLFTYVHVHMYTYLHSNMYMYIHTCIHRLPTYIDTYKKTTLLYAKY